MFRKSGLLILLSFVLSTGCHKKETEPEDLVEVEQADVLKTVEFFGKFERGNRRLIVSPIESKISTVHVKNGDKVKQGDTLVSFDKLNFEQKLRSQKSIISQIDLDERSLAVSIQGILKDQNRIQRAIQLRAIARSELDQINTKLNVAKKDLEKVKQRKRYEEEVLSDLNTSMNSLVLKAPVDAYVLEVSQNIENTTGQLVKVGDHLLTLVTGSSARVKAVVPEFIVSNLYEGQNVQLSMTSYSGSEMEGKILSITQRSSQDVGVQNYDVMIDVPKSVDKIRPGFEALVKALIGKRSKALSVPKSAIRSIDGQYFVQALSESNHYEKTPIRLGLIGDEQVEITEGLSLNQKVKKIYE